MRRFVLLGFAAALLALGAVGPPRHDDGTPIDRLDPRPAVAAAAGGNRAGVVIDDGVSVRRACIRFSGTLTGIEALQRASAPTLAAFGNLGVAVCAIDGHGCPADGSCLTCKQPNAWVYWRAPAGSGGFGFSSLGASNTTVRDGDVEGWRWGPGAPPYASVESICGESTPATPAPSPPPLGGGEDDASTARSTPKQAPSGAGGASAPDGGAAPEVAGTRASSSTSSSTAPGAAEPETTADADGGPTTTERDGSAASDTDERDVDEQAAVAVDSADGSGGSGTTVGAVVLGLVLVGLAAAFVVARRRGRASRSAAS